MPAEPDRRDNMATAIVLLIVAACAALEFFKGTVFKAVITTILVICAAIIAFGYFETAADYFIAQGSKSRLPALVPWAQPLCFVLIFILSFAVLQTIAAMLTKSPVEFEELPEQIGRPLCGAFLGLIVSGLLLTVLAMAPLPGKYPYQRFDRPAGPAALRPNKPFPATDSLVTGWFAAVSKGSFRPIRNPKSFAVLHPSYIDELFLNRLSEDKNVTLVTHKDSIEVPRKKAETGYNGLWYAPAAGITDTQGKPLTVRSNHSLIVVRAAIIKGYLRDAGNFTLSQLRLVCKPKDPPSGPLEGKAIDVYPIGFFSAPSQIQTKRLGERISVLQAHYTPGQREKYIDFVFEVPDDHLPVLLAFKQNCITELPKPVSADQAPEIIPFKESPLPAEGTPGEEPVDYSPRRTRSSENESNGSGLTITRPVAPVMDPELTR